MMTTLNLELFEALQEAGASEAKAKAAASSPSSIDARLARMETKINYLFPFVAAVQGALVAWLKFGGA